MLISGHSKTPFVAGPDPSSRAASDSASRHPNRLAACAHGYYQIRKSDCTPLPTQASQFTPPPPIGRFHTLRSEPDNYQHLLTIVDNY